MECQFLPTAKELFVGLIFALILVAEFWLMTHFLNRWSDTRPTKGN